jgi:hypothetical protein
MTELASLKDTIEDGESCVYAYEQVDLDAMRAEGDGEVADMIEQTLKLVGLINAAAGIE